MENIVLAGTTSDTVMADLKIRNLMHKWLFVIGEDCPHMFIEYHSRESYKERRAVIAEKGLTFSTYNLTAIEDHNMLTLDDLLGAATQGDSTRQSH